MERISVDRFNNTFTTDTGNPEKNTPSLDYIDNEGNVSTCRSLKYSRSSPCNSEVSAISDIMIATALTTAIGHTAAKEVQ